MDNKSMSIRHQRVLDSKDKIKSVIASLGLHSPRLVGSVARNQDNESSDIDILVSGSYNNILDVVKVERELGEFLFTPVEIVVDNEVHGYVLDSMNKDSEIL